MRCTSYTVTMIITWSNPIESNRIASHRKHYTDKMVNKARMACFWAYSCLNASCKILRRIIGLTVKCEREQKSNGYYKTIFGWINLALYIIIFKLDAIVGTSQKGQTHKHTNIHPTLTQTYIWTCVFLYLNLMCWVVRHVKFPGQHISIICDAESAEQEWKV